jgi:hypothetical protein
VDNNQCIVYECVVRGHDLYVTCLRMFPRGLTLSVRV